MEIKANLPSFIDNHSSVFMVSPFISIPRINTEFIIEHTNKNKKSDSSFNYV